MALSREELRQLALSGARERLQQIEQERRALIREFPELGTRQSLGGNRGRRQRRMSAAQRRAISRRMKALWAERRKAKGKAA